MPNIRTYDNNLEAPRPVEGGAQAYEMEGRHISADYSAAGQEIGGGVARVGGQYVKHEERLETTQLGADLATAHANLTVQWNAIAAKTDPKDIEKAADDFRTNIAGPALDAIGSKLNTEGGQDMFARASAGIKDDIFQKTAADTSRLQADGAVSNILTMKNQATNNVFADPSSFSSTMDLMHETFNGMQKSFNLPAPERLKLEQETAHDIAKATALGMLQKDPTQGKADIADGRFDKYLSGEEIAELQNHGNELVRAQTTAEKAAEEEQRRQQKDAADQFANRLQTSMLQSDGSLRLTPTSARDAVNYSMMPGVTSGDGRAMIDMVHRVAEDASKPIPPKTDPATYESLRARLMLPSTDPQALTPRDVIQARASGMLDDKDFSFLRSSIDTLAKDPAGKLAATQLNDFLKGMKSTITKSNPMMGMLDGAGDQRFYQFSVDARNAFSAGIARGDKASDLLDPNGKDYIGKMVPQYQIGTKQGLQMMQNQFSGQPTALAPVGSMAARRPGESAADFLKRQGGG